jgi:hypothetical protein
MWSIERIYQPEVEGKDSDTDPQRMKIKMIRIKPTTAPMMVEEEDEDPSKEIKEQGYIVGAKGNQSEINLLEHCRRIEIQENSLEEEYDDVNKRTPSDQSKIEDILRRQIDIKIEKTKKYEIAHVQEKLLRRKAVYELRKHEIKSANWAFIDDLPW